MHANAKVIETFYRAFTTMDAKAMGACYHPEAKFHDPVFLDLEGWQAKAMWQMFCENAKAVDLRVEFSGIDADERTGRAHWDAWYNFVATGRPVLNRIDATFEFKDGKLYRHRDDFPLWKWSRMALGPIGVALGWSPLVTGKIRSEARKRLNGYIAEHKLSP